ncbi:MAG: hypothetical protein V4503_12010 [Gemmatimonadota bacterium]
MKGLIRGAAGLAVLLGMSACANDATVDLMGPPTGVQATPTKAFILKGDSVAVLVRLVNDRNQAISTEFAVANVGPALSVAYDADYRPDYNNPDGTLQAPAIKPEQRYFAKGAQLGTSTFDLTSNGLTTTVTVVVRPKSLEAALNKTTGLTYGDTVTITAPAGLKFTPSSAVTFATGPSSIASRSADSSSIKVVLGPGTGGVATVTNVFMTYAPTLALQSLATTNAVATTTAILPQPTMAPTSGLVAGSIVTITAPAGLVFSRTPAITFPTGSVAIQSVSADSSSVNIIIGPGVSGPATITKMGIIKAPNVGTFTVTTSNSLAAVPAVTVAPTAVSTTTPAFGASMTVTLSAGLRFTSTSTVSIGGRPAIILSRSADSATATIVPAGGSNGNVTYTNIVLSFLNTVALSAPGDKTVTVGAATPVPANGAIATANEITLPAVGVVSVVSDAGAFVAGGPCGLSSVGGDGCRYLKINLATARTVDFSLSWEATATADMGLYLVNAAGTSASTIADAAGNQTGGTETKTSQALPAGVSYIAIVWYNYAPGTGAPAFTHIKITGK